MATLTYISDEGVETSYPVGENEPEVHIGRHKSCNIRTTNQSVSRYHARVFFDGSTYYLQDNESVNGTFYENERLKPGEPVLVEDGHYLMCGNFELRFDLDDEDFGRSAVEEPEVYEPVEEDESTRFAQSYEPGDYYSPPPPPPPPPPAYAPPPPPPPPAYAPPPPPVATYVEPVRSRTSAPQHADPPYVEDQGPLIEGLRADLAQRDGRISELRIEIDSLNRRLEEARNDPAKGQLQTDLDNARRGANDAIAESDGLRQDLARLQQELATSGAEVADLKAQLAEAGSGSRPDDERHIEALENELQVLRESLSAAQEKFEEARAGRRNAEELANLQKMRAEANEAAVTTLKQELARLQQQLNSAAASEETVSAAEYDAQVEAREEAETRAHKVERESVQLRKELEAVRASVASSEQITELQEKLTESRALLAAAEAKAATVSEGESAELARLRLQHKADKARIAQLEADLGAGPAGAPGDGEALGAAQAEIARLQSELASAQSSGGNAGDLQAQLDKLTAANRELQETISANLKRIQRLTAQAGGGSDDLKRQVAQLQDELAAARAENQTLQSQGGGGAGPDAKVSRLVQDLNGFVKSFINEFDAVADAIERMSGEDQADREEAAAELPENLEKCQNLSQEIKNLVRDLRVSVEG